MWNFEVIDSLPSEAKSDHVFFHPAIIRAWMNTYRPLRKLTALYIRASYAQTVLYLPLVLWTRNWKHAFQRTVIPIGYSDYDYHDPIIVGLKADENAVKAFWCELEKYLNDNYCFDRFEFEGITDSMALGKGWERGEICPRLNLTEIQNEESLMKFFKTSLRGDLRRQIRRLEELGPLRFTEYTSWESLPEATFDRFMNQHSQRWPNAYKAPRFHENLLREGLPSGVVHFSTLSVGDCEIAWHLGFSYNGKYYYYMPAGNQDYFRFSPTKIHLFYLMRRAVEQGYEVFDHLRGEETYKSGWSNDHIYVNTFRGSNESIRSQIADNMMKIKGIITPPDNILLFTSLRLAS